MRLPGENAIIMAQNFKYRNPAYPGDILTISGELCALDPRFSTMDVKVKIKNQDNLLISSGFYDVKVRG